MARGVKMDGWIKLHKQFLNWEWFTDINTCHLFLYCLVRAQFKDTNWKGIVIKRGSFVTSYQSLSNATGLSVQNVRTSLKKLTDKLTGELTHIKTSKYSIITVKNYDKYQVVNMQDNTQVNSQLTTNKELKNISNISYINTHTIECGGISKEDELILRNYAKKSKANNIDAYVHALISNGAYKDILVKEKERIQRKKEKEDFPRIEPVVLTDQDKAEIAEIQKRTRENLRRRS